MGATYVTIEVGIAHGERFQSVGERFQSVEVMVGTGATFSTVPASLLRNQSPQELGPISSTEGDGPARRWEHH